jgi:copper homeostasis protein (lipoprotein)
LKVFLFAKINFMPKLNTFFQSFMLFGMMFFTLISCSNRNLASDDSTEASYIGVHNSKNSLDWAGVYRGVLPCADCEGIQTEIKINDKSEFTLSKQYLGRSSQVLVSEGFFTWDEYGGKIILENEQMSFMVGENRLILLDKDSKRIKNDSGEDFFLVKKTDNLRNRKWYLVELKGEEIHINETLKKLPYIQFQEGEKVSGHAGCNSFHGTYNLSDGNRISFSQMGLTRLACADMETEQNLMEVLEQADNYHVRADTFQLNQARLAPLARFEYRFFD